MVRGSDSEVRSFNLHIQSLVSEIAVLGLLNLSHDFCEPLQSLGAVASK